MEKYNAVNITLDLFSMVITIMIGVYLISRRNPSKENRCFLWICIWNTLFIVGDLSDWYCNGLEHSWYPAALQAGQFLYYAVMVPFLYTMMVCVIEYLSTFGQVSPFYVRVTGLFSVLHLLGCIVTPFTGLFYVISDENIYFRGKGVLLASILPVLVYLLIIILVFQFRKKLQLRGVIVLLSYVWFPLLGQVIQNRFRGVATLNPAITLAILFMFFNIQLDRDVQYEKNKQKLTEANIKIMLSQIQPHFLYNTLAVIRGLCTTDSEKAKEAINDFSVFLRANMESLANEKSIPFEQELIHTTSYLNLITQMYGENIKVEYDIKTTGFKIPALSLQPLVENAVHKGIRKKEGGGSILIRTQEVENYFKIIISDDGVGFDLNILKENGHFGIQNVRTRLALMCDGIMNVDSKIGKGTIVEILIPKHGGESSNELFSG